MTVAVHPLTPLDEEEVRAAASAVRLHPDFPDKAMFASVSLLEPPKSALTNGHVPPREAEVILYDSNTRLVIEAAVSIADQRVIGWRPVPGANPKLIGTEFLSVVHAVKADARWQEAMRRRGVEDFSNIEVQPWPPAWLEDEGLAKGRRIANALTWVGLFPNDNVYARPVEGLVIKVDLDTAEVLEVQEVGDVPLPPFAGNYAPELAADGKNVPVLGAVRGDVRPLEITQPEGPSFTLEGAQLRWQHWRVVVGFTTREGLVLHDVRYEDGGRERRILHRASLAEMWVPYGDPAPLHRVKGVFDEGEAGLGWLANRLELGCDCLGEIAYMDAIVNNDQGEPARMPNAICIHEEDTGIAWKHTNAWTGAVEVRRGRRLVISSFSTIGNYDYGFFWYLHTDGTIAYEVKLTGIVSTGAFADGERPRHGAVLAPGLYAPHHQHFFNVRLDVAIDGDRNSVFEVDAEPCPPGPDNPVGNAWVAAERPIDNERDGQRLANPAAGRTWLIVNESVRNAHGGPVGYQLVPGPSARPPFQPDAPALQRALFTTKHLWVTAFDPTERYAAGDYVYEHPGGAGLPSYTRAERSVRDTDIVVWHTFVAHHLVRPEDWPVMPVATTGFHLRPFGFFDANPALDLPRPAAHCAGQ
ncbi:MAG: primary-amine oxidase [Acidimicrobiaceae bacterium]|nr:primary-amine oxidase [Acidimicrobiaceae bacterium]